jgi:hypothetical protein
MVVLLGFNLVLHHWSFGEPGFRQRPKKFF